MSKELPNGWTKTTLSTLVGPGGLFTDGDWILSEHLKTGNDVRLIQLADVGVGRFVDKSNKHISHKTAEALRVTYLQENDVLISRMADPLARACLFPQIDEASITAVDVAIARCDDVVSYAEYVMHLCNSSIVLMQAEEVAVGTTRKRISRKNLEKIVVPLPPLNEQRRIVAKLEVLLERVNDCQKRLEKIPVILKRFRQSVLAAACSGKLTANFRENDTLVNDIPKLWAVHTLEDICDLITKGASPKWQGVNYADKGVLFVTSENVGNGKLLLNTRKYVEPKINEIQPRSVLRKGDLLTNIVGASIGRSAIYDLDDAANINQAVALIRLKSGVERKYVLYVLNSPSILDYMEMEKVDVARANLSLKDVSHFPIPVPPHNEQQEIIMRVDGLFALAAKLEARYVKAKAQVDKLTQSILAKAFRGELVPQDPNDEPASVLLEKIKASKMSTKQNGRKKKRPVNA